jgi:hypothetical protein
MRGSGEEMREGRGREDKEAGFLRQTWSDCAFWSLFGKMMWRGGGEKTFFSRWPVLLKRVEVSKWDVPDETPYEAVLQSELETICSLRSSRSSRSPTKSHSSSGGVFEGLSDLNLRDSAKTARAMCRSERGVRMKGGPRGGRCGGRSRTCEMTGNNEFKSWRGFGGSIKGFEM